MRSGLMVVAAAVVFLQSVSIGQTPLGTSFTYQGELTLQGLPADGSFDMRFRLYDAPIAPASQVGPTRTFDGSAGNGAPVAVRAGLFTAQLDFGNVFSDTSLWLEFEVREHVIVPGSYVVLSPRQLLASAPFASHTRGIRVDGNLNVGIGVPIPSNRLSVGGNADFEGNVGIGTTGPAYPLHISTATARALYASSTLATGSAFGVYGVSASDNGRGVFGYASASAGMNYGVFGSTNSSDGYAGYFLGRGYFSDQVGIGTTSPSSTLHVETADNPPQASIYGNHTRTSGQVIGVLGRSAGDIGAGVRGEGFYGVYGNTLELSGSAVYASANSSTNAGYAVRANCAHASGYAGYFEGGRNFFEGRVGIGSGMENPIFALQLALNSAAKPTSGTWTIASDARLKKHVRTIEHALEDVLALRGVTYEWIDPASQGGMDGVYTGLIAQEVEGVFPEWISEDSSGIKHLTVIGFEGLAVEAIRELRAEKDAQIEVLRQENAELSARVARLESILVASARADSLEPGE